MNTTTDAHWETHEGIAIYGEWQVDPTYGVETFSGTDPRGRSVTYRPGQDARGTYYSPAICIDGEWHW